MTDSINSLVNFIPLILVLIIIVGIFVAGLRYPHKKSRAYSRHLKWGVLTCMFSVLVLLLVLRQITEGRFIAPVIMSLILLMFLTFMTLLPISSPSVKEKERNVD